MKQTKKKLNEKEMTTTTSPTKKKNKKKNCLLTRADRISLEFLSCFMARKDFSQLSPTTFFSFSLILFFVFFQLLLAIRYYKQE